MNSAIVYRGPSELDGAPIVVIATGFTGNSANKKTGAVVNTWILRSDMEPTEARMTGADSSICGNCRNRVGSCYVELYRAPLTIFRKFQRGEYQEVALIELPSLTAGKPLRIGTYGDPAAVPHEVWDALVSRASHWTGYTHQWRTAKHLQWLCMASVDNASERAEAMAMGWRTFRVRVQDEPLLPSEFICPASAEAGKKTTCEECNSCDGSRQQKGTPVIIVHGITGKQRTFFWAHKMPHGDLATVSGELKRLGLAIDSTSPAAKLRRELYAKASA